MAEKSIRDAHLADIDRRLRMIQAGLAPATQAQADPRDPQLVEAAPPASEPVDLPEPVAAPERLLEAPAASDAASLIAQLRALLDAHERLLAPSRNALTAPGTPARDQTVGVSAGPFENTEALRRFEQSLWDLPEVRSVTVRAYEGADRVIVDVHLAAPNP